MKRLKRDVWAIINAFDRGVLEKVRGRSLLDIAVGNLSNKKPAFGHVYVATDDEYVVAAAKRLGAELPRRVFTRRPDNILDHRATAFHATDYIVQENAGRMYGRNEPKRIVAVDPFYPFTSCPTLEDVYDGVMRCTLSIPVVDVVQGLVMPVWSIFGHLYSPPGTRPHEDYDQFLAYTGSKHFTVQIVRVNSLAEVASCRDRDVFNNLNNLTRNRAFRLQLDISCETLYVPNGNSWGCYLPVDADFVYDAAHDVRIFRNGEKHARSESAKVGHHVLQQTAEKEEHRRS